MQRASLLALLLALACHPEKKAEVSAADAAPAPKGFRGGAPCPGSKLECGRFESPQAALAAVLQDSPLVLAIGEAHAQKGSSVPSSAKRMTSQLLPELKGKASDLLVELMNPPTGCTKTTAEVKEKQKVVTQKQADTDQNEYVQMGEAARALGVVPDLLRPSCEDLAAIDDAGADAVDASLKLIARLTKAKVRALRGRDDANPADAAKMVLTYGGAIHNDLAPSPESSAWAFGPDLAAEVGGRYVELDVYVPEFIKDTPAWRDLEWYGDYDASKLGDSVTLFHPREHGFVMIFARTPSAGP